MSPATFIRHLARESRGGGRRLVFFVVCLAIGVGAVVSVAGLSSAIDAGVRREARQLLAADLVVRGRRPIPEAALAAIDATAGSARTDIREMLTVVAAPGGSDADGDDAPGRSQLTELKSVGGEYPFYGTLELEPDRPLAELLADDATIVAPAVLSRLGLEIGDGLRIGGRDFRIAGVVHREPDHMAGAFAMGPRVFVSAGGLERAELERYGSRILYRSLVRLPEEAGAEGLDALAERLDELLPADGRFGVETFTEAQPALRQGLRRLESFLGLAALLSLLIGGVGVAQTVRAWLAGRLDAIAVLKCVGYRPREVLGLYLGQVAVLGLVGSVAGIAVGVGLELLVARLLRDVLPVATIDPWQPLAMLQGLVLGTGVGLLFSLPPLAAARRVPPIRVLRRNAEPLPPSRPAAWTSATLLVLTVAGLAAWQARSPARGALFTLGLLIAVGALALAARLLIRLAHRPRRNAGLWLRHGLAALGRPGASTVGATVALGLGVLVLLTMFLVETRLTDQLRRDLPSAAPTAFLVDIQPDQWPGVEALLAEHGAERIDSVPVVMARIATIDGRDTDELLAADEDDEEGDDDRPWAIGREQRLTYLEELPADNRIVAGALWSDSEHGEVSVEQDFARLLDVDVGSRLRFDVQGVPIELLVSSIRTVDWQTFGINFYLVVEPGVLDDAPQHRVAAARLPAGGEQPVQDALAAAYPNVSMIRIREVLDRLAAILGKLGLGVRLLGALTVVAGLAILAGAVSAGALRRGSEVALLKTLGMTRGQVMAAFAVEYALLGITAGALGAFGGTVLAYFITTHGMEIPWDLRPFWATAQWPFVALVATALLAVVAGLAASTSALRRRPIEALRNPA